MGRISEAAKKRYSEKIREYKNITEEMQRREKSLIAVIQKEDNGAEYQRFTLSEEILDRISYLTLMNKLSVALLGVKNESFLNDARKDIYKSIIYLEENVTGYIDVPFSDYEEKIRKFEDYNERQRYALLRKLGFSIQSVKDGFGENTKWKWSFVEMEGRFATVSKNLLDFKTLVAGLDPRVDGYEVRLAHLDLTKRMLQHSADRYREKYELSTSRIDDFKLAINYLSALRRVHLMLGEADQGDTVKKKLDVWKNKMESDSRRAEGK